MTTTVFLAVLFAAFLHAVWNALVKRGTDQALTMTAITLGGVPVAMITLLFVSPPALESLPYILLSVMLQIGYHSFLLAAYKLGDYVQVYPIARGSAPLIITLASLTLLDVVLGPLELVSVGLIAGGLVCLAIVRQNGVRHLKPALYALVTGGFIAAYSLVDGIGARVAGGAFGYYSWIAIGTGVVFGLMMEVRRRGISKRAVIEARLTFWVGGIACFAAYAVVVWCFTQAPVALVAALREVSIVFAVLLGWLFLKEKLSLAILLAVSLTLSGAALLRFSTYAG